MVTIPDLLENLGTPKHTQNIQNVVDVLKSRFKISLYKGNRLERTGTETLLRSFLYLSFVYLPM